jgi:polyketide biosynthesis acyl carrier protein
MNQTEILGVIIGYLREVLPQLADRPIQPGFSMRDLGANSIDRSEVIMLTLERLNLKIPLVELASAGNIGALARTIHARSLA